ncbi:MAG: hypothetical protein EPN86_05875 [Nanoarchaeota archaeon]|nr:MAG: hypothetical protein EPN86_05875 [Nanoarchaeota archaeon]
MDQIEELYKELDPLKEKLSEQVKLRESLFAEREEIRKQFESKVQELRQLKRKRDELNHAVHAKKDERNKLTEQIRALIAKLNEAKTKKEGIKKDNKENPSFLNQQIKKLEQKVETEVMSQENEKKMMKKIKEIRKKLNEMKAFMDASATVSGSVRELRTVKKQADDVHRQVQEKAKESQQVHEQMTGVGKLLDNMKPKEAELTNKIAAIKEEISVTTKLMDEKSSQIRGIKEKEYQEKAKEKAVQRAEEEIILKQKEADVNDKLKRGKKLTTDDLLVFQRQQEEK